MSGFVEVARDYLTKLESVARDYDAAREAIPDDMVIDTLTDAITALVEQRDEARAERDRPRVDDRNARAIANVAHREGYSDALGDVLDAVDNIPDVFDAEWRLAFLSGWLTARKPVTR